MHCSHVESGGSTFDTRSIANQDEERLAQRTSSIARFALTQIASQDEEDQTQAWLMIRALTYIREQAEPDFSNAETLDKTELVAGLMWASLHDPSLRIPPALVVQAGWNLYNETGSEEDRRRLLHFVAHRDIISSLTGTELSQTDWPLLLEDAQGRLRRHAVGLALYLYDQGVLDEQQILDWNINCILRSSQLKPPEFKKTDSSRF